MKAIKDGEKIFVVDESGTEKAYIEKYYFGTHGHYRGYTHFVFSETAGRFLWAGVTEYNNGEFKPWTAAPAYFPNLKEFKTYYGI